MEDSQDYCTKCGKSLKSDVEFCTHCGAPTKGKARTKGAVVGAKMKLFDVRRSYYVIDRSSGTWGSGPIYDEMGKAIGFMHRPAISMRPSTEFREANDETVAASINTSLSTFSMEIKDSQKSVLARIKKKALSLRPTYWVDDPSGNRIMELKGDVASFSFQVYDLKGNIIAQIDRTDVWKDIFFRGGPFDFGGKYAVAVNGDIDRRLILPIPIAIDADIQGQRERQKDERRREDDKRRREQDQRRREEDERRREAGRRRQEADRRRREEEARRRRH